MSAGPGRNKQPNYSDKRRLQIEWERRLRDAVRKVGIRDPKIHWK